MMKKRILSLLCVLALCLGLLPVTALAAEGAPNSLYVGNQQVISGSDITYWTTGTDGQLTKSTDNQSWNVKYDPSTATLTLSGATINGGSNTGSAPFGSGIYAECGSGQSVALTIELIGTNTITGYYGIFLNAEKDATSYGTDASLTITGENNGSLEVSGSDHGIYVKSGTGNASINIKNVAVTSSTNGNSAAGVYVMSSSTAANSPNISLSVDGGSLTASGTGSSDGIWFYVGSSQATGATTSLTVSENAIVDARNGGISVSETLPTPTPTGDNRSGIVFDGSTGTVYGTVALQNELTIGEGESLTVPEGSSLNCNGKLTNNGTILASGGTVTGRLSGGSEVTTPSISAQPTNQTVTEGGNVKFSVTASDAQTYQWQQSTDSGSNWTNIESATSAKYTTEATTTSMSDNQYRCVVTSASGVSVISQAATLTVTELSVDAPTTLYVGNHQITYGDTITYLKAGSTEGSLTEGSADEWTVKYDPSTATLTLNGATIKGVSNNVNIVGSGIYAASRSGPVSLNIVLEGENKVSGGYGINVSSGGAASLSISGSGSLTVSATAVNGIGIFVQAQSGDANLTIDGANVNAVVTENNGRGVELSTGQAGNPNLTIEVKGGSLQASGQPNGIIFFTNKNNTQANANLKVSGNAMVKTSGITTKADGSGSQGAVLTTEAGTGETGGIVWIGSEGTVYGSVTLQDDLTISEGESLTIGDGASLTVPVGKTMTNNGTVTTTGSGTLINNGTINNSGTLPETISGNQPPKITTASLPDGKKYTAYNETLQADNTPTQWSITSGSLPAGLTLDTSTGLISGTPTADGTSTFTVKAENSAGSDSKVYTLKVTQTIRITIIMTDSSVQYRYTEEGGIVTSYPVGYAFFFKDGDTKTWINKGTQTYDADTTIYAENMTLEKIPAKSPTCTENGNSEYWYCETYDKYFSDENGVNEITYESTVLPATGHGESEVKGAKEATCTEDGYTGDKVCKVCGEILERGTVIEKIGHVWGEPEWNWSEDGKTCKVTFTCENNPEHKETPKVTITSSVKTPATCTESGVTTYTATVELNGQTYTDAKDVADLAATGHSYENGKCTVCGTIDPDFKVAITAGANGTWQKGTKDGLSFTSNAAFADFQKVQVDGKDLDASNYMVKEGSTIVTLKAEYLETLSVGKHTLAIVSETGTATTEFTIKAAVTDDTQSPQTGDSSNIMLWIALLFVSGGVLCASIVNSKKKSERSR